MKHDEFKSFNVSENGRLKLAELSRKNKERLEKMVNETIYDKSPDGFIKITIPSLGIITWASDIEDCKVAISEAIESFRIQSERYS